MGEGVYGGISCRVSWGMAVTWVMHDLLEQLGERCLENSRTHEDKYLPWNTYAVLQKSGQV